MKKARVTNDPDSSKAAYLVALRWLMGRELSEGQVRQRLTDRGYSDAATNPAVARLIQEHTIDDRRAATAVARAEARIRRHGPRRVLAKLIAMRIDRDLARDVVSELFSDSNEEEMLQTTLERRLRAKPERLNDPNERRRLLAYLVRQGFSPSAASKALRRKSK